MPWKELSHTADWALRVWADDRLSLLQEALAGMYALLGVQEAAMAAGTPQQLTLTAPDDESLLVAFLNEALYWLEEGVIWHQARLQRQGDALLVTFFPVPVARVEKEIKAVTYHNLHIRQRPQGVETTLVFDV